MFDEATLLAALRHHFPEPRIELDFRNNYELLIVVLLSAQTTDVTINKLSPGLFNRFPDPATLARADLRELEALLRPAGFFRRKAQLIRACAQGLVEKYAGIVPGTIEELVQLPGVGRKTASAVLVSGFGKPAIVVDTHVIRLVTERWGLVRSKDPTKIEECLAAFFKPENWAFASTALVLFGRHVCTARRPLCPTCALNANCPYGAKTI